MKLIYFLLNVGTLLFSGFAEAGLRTDVSSPTENGDIPSDSTYSGDSIPRMFELDSNFTLKPPEVENALLPTLLQLANNLDRWGRANQSMFLPRGLTGLFQRIRNKFDTRRASKDLARIADPKAGLWFWENTGVSPTPTVRFPLSREQNFIHYTVAMAACEAASNLRTALDKPGFLQTITRSPSVKADLIQNIDLFDEYKRLDLKVHRALPVQAKVLLKPDSNDEEPWSVEIYLTIYGKRLYIAHVIYRDGSA